MPTIVERPESRTLDDQGVDQTAQLLYTVVFDFGETVDEGVAYSVVHGTAPTLFRGLIKQRIQIAPRSGDQFRWDGTVDYGRVELLKPGEGERFSFNTTGGTAHITQSLETVQTYGDDPPDCKGAIGVNGDSVEGTDITVPQSQFSVTRVVPALLITLEYHSLLEDLTGTVNAATFRGRPRGSVLFLGAQGDGEVGKDCEITFNFAHSKNATDLQIGDISGVAKEGWHYLWIRYKDEESGEELVKVPSSVHVERVYEYGDFAGLGIPV